MFRRQLIKVTEKVVCVRHPSYFACSYLIKAPNGVIAVDAGMRSDGSDILEGMKFLNEPISSLKAILLTHWHNDHAAGACKAKEASGASVYYSKREEPYFLRQTARGGMRGWVCNVVPEWGLFVLAKGLLGEAPPLSVTATKLLVDGELIVNEFVAIETPGHTDGHLSYYYKPDKILFSGDALAVIDGHIRYMARPVTLNHANAKESMKKILSLDIAILCPGHRQPLVIENPNICSEVMSKIEKDEKWPFFG